MAMEAFIQRSVHALEAGGLVVYVRRGLISVAIIALALFYLLHEFRGLGTSQGMDQAQIGREIARGHGWKTKLIRPASIGQLQRNDKDVPSHIWYDTYNAPLPPLVDALALLPVKAYWKMTPRDIIYTGDRAIALVAVLLFVCSVGVLYLIAVRLFDERLAILACGLVLVCDMMWQYSLSGLPQMLLLLLFNLTVYAVVRAVQAQYGGGFVGLWLAAIGLGFGLLALAHALTIWIFLPAFVFAIFFFRPRGWAAVIILGVFLLTYSPWLARNQIVSGNPTGIAFYAALDQVRHSEAGHMRRADLDLEGISPGYFRSKFFSNAIHQFNRIFEYLGWSVVAPVFFLSLFHPFKRPETNILRGMLLAMWGGAVVGMIIFGLPDEEGISANQLHLLFMPLMTCFGLAFLLVQWNKLNIEFRFIRIGFLTLIFLLSGLPVLLALLTSSTKSGIHWPPYVPPYIAVLNDWMEPDEIVGSDMPWAVAWYADRRSVWIPETVKQFTDLNDYDVLHAPVNGLYLTPISGSSNTLRDILKGEYKDWSPFIFRSVNLEKFSLKWATLLGLENECLFFSDHDRSKPKADK